MGAVAAANGHSSIVLGAWGCGVFACDADFVAQSWMALLTDQFEGVFENVVYAIPVIRGDTTNLDKFRHAVSAFESGAGKVYGLNRTGAIGASKITVRQGGSS